MVRDGLDVDPRIAGGRGAHQVVERHPVRPRQGQELLQRRAALARFQARKRADRDPRACGEFLQRGVARRCAGPAAAALPGKACLQSLAPWRQFAISAKMFGVFWRSGCTLDAVRTARQRDESQGAKPHGKPGKTYDVVIIGGGAAGLSAAQALGRARRSVLVVDAGEPRNAPADAMHNYLSRDGMNPLEFLAAGRAELADYGVTLLPIGQRTAAAPRRDSRLAGTAIPRSRPGGSSSPAG